MSDDLPEVNKPSPEPSKNTYDQAISGDHSTVNKPPPEPSKKPPENDIHTVKWIEFNHERLPILLQNMNGPCPLLALSNILLLRKQVKDLFDIKNSKNCIISYRFVLIQM